jgi:hypothetical protein
LLNSFCPRIQNPASGNSIDEVALSTKRRAEVKEKEGVKFSFHGKAEDNVVLFSQVGSRPIHRGNEDDDAAVRKRRTTVAAAATVSLETTTDSAAESGKQLLDDVKVTNVDRRRKEEEEGDDFDKRSDRNADANLTLQISMNISVVGSSKEQANYARSEQGRS